MGNPVPLLAGLVVVYAASYLGRLLAEMLIVAAGRVAGEVTRLVHEPAPVARHRHVPAPRLTLVRVPVLRHHRVTPASLAQHAA